jgi:O-succinylbenzoic acid--CoA ligase
MTPTFDKIHNKFKFNGLYFDREALKEVAYSLIKEGELYEKEMGDFLLEWTNDRPIVEVRTSGSTGAPKMVIIKKEAMVASAIATGNFFSLEPGDTCLHCLPTHFIAGKMMLVRAMILGLEVTTVEPLSRPVYDTNKTFDFCAMVPLQLENTINFTKNIKKLIVGGAAVPKSLISAVQKLKTEVYETYGMTETITHIAAKRLNGKQKSKYFTTLPGVLVTQDERDCLVIKAPYLSSEPLVTNDIVELVSEHEFRWLGRADHVINVGGLKVQPEQVEAKLRDKFQNRILITSAHDSKLGEHVVMIVESDPFEISKEIFSDLEKFEVPKTVYFIPKFIEKTPGKIQILETLNKAKMS